MNVDKAEDFNGYLVIWHRTPDSPTTLDDCTYATLDQAMRAIQAAVDNRNSFAANGGTVIKSTFLYSLAPGWEERTSSKPEVGP